MVLGRKRLAFLLVAVLLLAGCATVAQSEFHRADAALALVTVALALGCYIIVCWERVRYYERFGLISMNNKLEAALRAHLRSGGVGRVRDRLYYRSQGRRARRSPWPRIWVVEVGSLARLHVGESQDIRALVVWPVPFTGGIRHCYTTMCVARDTVNSYSMHPEPLPNHKWKRLKDLDEEELTKLATKLQIVLTDLQKIHNRERVGSKHQFRLGA